MEILVVLFLVLLNGVFAGTELAVLGARSGRLRHRAERGDIGARTALELQSDPNRFLSAVQVGITSIGVLTGAFGGTQIAEDLEPTLASIPPIGSHAGGLSVAVVVIAITFVTLVLGEIVPKRLALLKPEAFAIVVAVPIAFLARVAAPIVSVLSASTSLVLALLGLRSAERAHITEADVRHLVSEGALEGTIARSEQRLIESVFALSDRNVRHVLTPRVNVTMLDAKTPVAEALEIALASGFSRLPVFDRTFDETVGVVHIRDLLALQRDKGLTAPIGDVAVPPLYVPDSILAADLATVFQRNRRHMALVVDEFGGFVGIVTLEDLLEELVGEIHDEFDADTPPRVVNRADGSMLVDGSLSLPDLDELLGETISGSAYAKGADTVAGFVVGILGRIPELGDVANWGDWRFEVVDMDGMRVDALLVSRPSAAQSNGA